MLIIAITIFIITTTAFFAVFIIFIVFIANTTIIFATNATTIITTKIYAYIYIAFLAIFKGF